MAGIHRLSSRTVATARRQALHGDGGGLYLQVTCGADGKPRRSWLVRFTLPDGRRREMGLGDAHVVGLASARDLAAAARKQAATGIDPIEARRQARAEAIAARAKSMTFRNCAETYIDTHAPSWKNAKHQWQWRNSLEKYAYPVFGDWAVGDINDAAVISVLEPIWSSKTETASRLRGRIEAILYWATVRGHRRGDNPARWRGHLQKALPLIKKSTRIRHHPALPFGQMAPFMKKLARQDGVSARALEFCILTATRTGETIGAGWSEIDFSQKVWTIPAGRMKMAREHRVPLSRGALRVLVRQRELQPNATEYAFVFPGRRESEPLSNMALLMTLKRMGMDDITTHGFRIS